MLKIPRDLFSQEKKPEDINAESLTSVLDDISEADFPQTSIEDIGWVTNVIEPTQQRGPSESP
ncbi:hypothetical protein AAC978_12355 [Desulfitobacterium sp. THU1]|uniref:hypothetical protein n=1 Tax=Desulfitobacterium sp. THU1 TaxID=3138072 RepID=UPI00311F7647